MESRSHEVEERDSFRESAICTNSTLFDFLNECDNLRVKVMELEKDVLGKNDDENGRIRELEEEIKDIRRKLKIMISIWRK